MIMNLFHNNYSKLKQQNADAIADLSSKNWNHLKKMFEYMSSYNVSLFELEVIKKDLIGATLEADANGIDLNEKIGMDDKEFCDTLLLDALTKRKGERILLMIKDILFWLLFMYTIGFIFDGFPSEFGISISDCFFAIIICNGGEFVTNLLNKYILYSFSKTQKITKIILAIVSIALLIFWLFNSNINNIFIVHGNGWLILTVLVLLTCGTTLGNNYYWNRCSKKYNWQ